MTLAEPETATVAPAAEEYLRRGRLMLDSAFEKLQRGSVAMGMDEVVLGTRRLREEDRELWRIFVESCCRQHPIAARLLEDPFTRRSFEKPRRYSGDSGMFEMIFAPETYGAPLDERSRGIFHYTTDGPAPRSVRARAALTAEKIDTLAAERPIRVLSLMGGHLWEAGLSAAAREGRVEKFVAFDGDMRALATIDAAGYGSSVITYQGSIRSLLRGHSVFRNFDLIYSGLCDNLGDPLASRFITGLVDALSPGGTLLLSNFAPDLVDIGYMEAFMDWNLVYRTEDGLRALVANAAGERLGSLRTYRDPHGNLVFVEARRTGG